MSDDALKVLEKHLEKCRSGELDPITRIFWQSLGDIIRKTARAYRSKGDYILDAGCGGGGLIINLTKEGAECCGISPLRGVFLLSAKENANKENIKLHQNRRYHGHVVLLKIRVSGFPMKTTGTDNQYLFTLPVH